MIPQHILKKIPSDEKILWHSQPHAFSYKLGFVFSFETLFVLAIFTLPALIVAIPHINDLLQNPLTFKSFLIFFFAHLFLFLVPLGFLLLFIWGAFKSYHNSYYLLTDKAVYYTNGVFNTDVNRNSLASIISVELESPLVSIFFHTKDIALNRKPNPNLANPKRVIYFCAIREYQKAFSIIQNAHQNALRLQKKKNQGEKNV